MGQTKLTGSFCHPKSGGSVLYQWMWPLPLSNYSFATSLGQDTVLV